jgi:SAM-dependent methyltransferase
MSFDPQHWEDMYTQNRPETLPWNAGAPDTDLAKLVNDGTIPVGQALELGTGPGHDAVFLIQHGFNVIGIDISPSAVVLARENASNAGLFGFFQQGDIRHIPVEDHFVDFVYDRGCFHTLDPQDRPQAVSEILRVLKKGGLFLLRVFSDKEPGQDGPHRFSRKELEDLFSAKFQVRKIWDGIFEGSRKPKSYSILMEKK